MLPLRPELQRGHYDVIGGLVADVCHYGLDGREPIPDRESLALAWRSYLAVNEAYAGALAATSASVTLIQDHHLLLVAAALGRSTVARQRPLHYFHHIPWCEPAYFGLLPEPIRRKLLIGALAHDTVAFHTRRWASAFIRCCERFLPGADCGDDEVTWVGRAVSVRAIPGTIDAEELRAAARTPAVGALAKRLRAESRGRSTVVRVDRWTPAKNALRGFLALEHLLNRRPDLPRQLWFLAVLSVPHRSCAATLSYHSSCRNVVARINDRFRSSAPDLADVITLLINDDSGQSNRNHVLAAMRIADTVLVNTLFDGMNLVAKESCVVADRDPVLVLSSNAGAVEELGPAALAVNPFDVVETALALERGTTMALAERRRRARELRAAATAVPVMAWLERQVTPLARAGLPRITRRATSIPHADCRAACAPAPQRRGIRIPTSELPSATPAPWAP